MSSIVSEASEEAYCRMSDRNDGSCRFDTSIDLRSFSMFNFAKDKDISRCSHLDECGIAAVRSESARSMEKSSLMEKRIDKPTDLLLAKQARMNGILRWSLRSDHRRGVSRTTRLNRRQTRDRQEVEISPSNIIDSTSSGIEAKPIPSSKGRM